MSEMEFDVVVVGTGPAAGQVIDEFAGNSRVAVVESRPVGGTCALRGCNPKKVLVNAAELIDWARRSQGELIQADQVKINWQDLIRFKRTFTESIPASSEKKYQEQGVQLLKGTARFTGKRSLTIDDKQVTGERIVICSGLRPMPLEFRGAEHLVHSDEFLETDQLPERIVFVGGGYISFEFAHVAIRAGAQVRIVEQADRPLLRFESDLVERLVEHSRKIGIQIDVKTQVQRVEKQADGSYRVHVSGDGKDRPIEADMVVHGAGRTPALDELDPAAGDVKFDRHGIEVNKYLQSVSNPHVYAAGDVAASGQPKLTPVANEEGRTVAMNLRDGNQHLPDYGAVPAAVFTVPALASVGISEAEAIKRGINFEIKRGDMSSWNSIRKVGGIAADYKILLDSNSKQILGAHLLGPHAAESINLFALAMKFNLTQRDLKSVLIVFPTFSSDVRQML